MFVWFVDGMMISSTGDFFIVQPYPMLSQLTVSNLISGSEVTITCRAENQAGEGNDTITIQGRIIIIAISLKHLLSNHQILLVHVLSPASVII